MGILSRGGDGGDHLNIYREVNLFIRVRIGGLWCWWRRCEGGLMEDAYELIVRNWGLATEVTYPYNGADGTCNMKKESSHATKIKGYKSVPVNSEKAPLKAFANQPVAVSIDARGSDFQFY